MFWKKQINKNCHKQKERHQLLGNFGGIPGKEADGVRMSENKFGENNSPNDDEKITVKQFHI